MPTRSLPLASADHVQRLERRVRRLQLGVLALLLLWALTTATGIRAASPPPDAIEAQRFHVVDESGKIRAILRGSARGAELVFLGPHGEPSLVISDRAQLVPLN